MSTWGKDEDETEKRMAAGGYSGKEISEALVGRSRNAVLGRAWRLGVSLTGEPKPAGKPKLIATGKKPAERVEKRKLTPRAPRLVPAKPINVEAFELPPVANDVAAAGVALADLEDGMCRWPVGSVFCGCKALPRKPYCPQHTYVSKLPPAPAQERTAKRAFYR